MQTEIKRRYDQSTHNHNYLEWDFICKFLDQENCTKETTDDEAGSIKANFKDTKVNKCNEIVPFIFNLDYILYHFSHVKSWK